MTSMTTITISPPSAQGSKKAESSKKEESKEKLMVALRIRPLKNDEKSRGYRCVAEKVDDRMVVLMDTSTGSKRDVAKTSIPSRHRRSNERQYVFDTTFGADSTQQEVYENTTQHLVKSVLDGFHATVFAYGATGSGKTYTMVGTPEHPGCMARALNELFETMENDHTVVFKVTMSYLEIYNENIRDLLNPGSGHLELRDDSRGRNITVAGLSEVTTKNTAEVMRLLQKGNKERTQEPTAANKTSSRSHALLMVNVKQTAKSRAQSRGAVKFGRLYMIDLAGSERASQTENRGKRLKEGAHINRSLLALGNVINALAEHKAKGHVNYRDSKLTRLLKEALSGNCQTVMIAHISPCEKSRDESRNTLVYADRAKNISSKVRKNVLDVSYHISQYQNIISDLRGEIGRLKEKIQSEAVFGGPSSGVKKAELQEMREQMVTNFKEQMNLRARLMEIDNHILSLTMEFERFNIIINEHEMNKAKNAHDRSYAELRKKSLRKSATSKKTNGKPSETDPPDTESDKDEAYEGDKEESGFEDNGSATNEDEDEELPTEDQVSIANLKSDEGDASEDEEEEAEEAAAAATEAASEAEEEEEEEEEPEEVRQAWDELLLIQREQQRYSDIKYDLEQDLEHCKKKQSKLEDELPKRISTEEEAEILALLCKVHELEIAKVEMQRDALLKEHEVRKRDLLILKYDKQRSLCDEIIERQRELIEGAAIPMPPELMELYNLYKQELETRNKKENQFVEELNNEIIRAPSMLSLRGGPSDQEDRLHSSHHLPPIKSSERTSTPEEKLFESRENLQEIDEGPESLPPRLGSQSSLRSSPTSSSVTAVATKIPSLPPINKRKSIRRSNSFGQARVDRYADMKTRLPRRFAGRRNSESEVAAAAKGGSRKTSLSRDSKPSRSKKKMNKNTDPFENIAITLERF